MKKNYQKNLSEFTKRLKNEPSLVFVEKLLKQFSAAEIFLVGGAVRDACLGVKDQKDYDFVVRNVNPKHLEKFLRALGTVNFVGKTFGVNKFRPKGFDEEIDIAYPRTEHAFGTGGYRDVAVHSDPHLPLEKDLSRRDFTINAIAFNWKTGKIMDPFGGLKDLVAKKIRSVGNSSQRIKEDYSRIFRALRFACQFDFAIEKNTLLAIKKMMAKISQTRPYDGKSERILPYEVLAKELIKTFYYHPSRAFDLYDKTGAFKELMPEILKMKKCPQPKEFHSEGDVWQHTRLTLENLNSARFKKEFGVDGKNAELVIAALLHDIGKPATLKTPQRDKTNRIRSDGHDTKGAEMAAKICHRLKLDSLPKCSIFRVNIDNVYKIIAGHMFPMSGEIARMRPTTIEKRFFNLNFPGENLLKLAFVDALSSLPPKGKPTTILYNAMKKRIQNLRATFNAKNRLPKPILDGREIMAYFKIKPGPKVGEILEFLREAQLSGKIKDKNQAKKYLEKFKGR